MKFDLSLYLVTDRSLLRGKDLLWTVEQAVLGGVSIVQLREKDTSSKEFYQLALSLKKILDRYKIPLIINDRLDIALAVDASGVHLGQSDLPCSTARQLLGKDKIIGLSIENSAQCQELQASSIDYIGYSPVFATATKDDTASPLGLQGVAQIATQVDLPGVAIGGIDAHNAGDVIKAGAKGIAVVSAIIASDDPQTAARELRQRVEAAKL